MRQDSVPNLPAAGASYWLRSAKSGLLLMLASFCQNRLASAYSLRSAKSSVALPQLVLFCQIPV